MEAIPPEVNHFTKSLTYNWPAGSGQRRKARSEGVWEASCWSAPASTLDLWGTLPESQCPRVPVTPCPWLASKAPAGPRAGRTARSRRRDAQEWRVWLGSLPLSCWVACRAGVPEGTVNGAVTVQLLGSGLMETEGA